MIRCSPLKGLHWSFDFELRDVVSNVISLIHRLKPFKKIAVQGLTAENQIPRITEQRKIKVPLYRLSKLSIIQLSFRDEAQKGILC